MLLTLLPGDLSGALAAGGSGDGVVYSRYVPEMAILNSYTGNSTGFYTSLKGPAEDGKEVTKSAYPQYNAMEMLYGKGYLWRAEFVKDDALEKTYEWSPKKINGAAPEYKDSTIKKLMQTKNNLGIKAAVSFQNYQHTHKKNSFKGWEVNSYLSANVSIGGSRSNYLYGSANLGVTNVRRGEDDDYNTINYYKDDGGGITFTRSKLEYTSGKECTCTGATADKTLITLRDAHAPTLKGVYYSSNGTDWKTRYTTDGWEIAGGKTLYIKLEYDEPIRFADDSAADKEKLYLGLQTPGDSIDVNHKAYLYRLDGDSVYFKYEMPSTLSEDKDVLELDTTSLFTPIEGSGKTEIELVQLCRGEKDDHFSLSSDLSGSDGKNGFSTSRSWITDLAGNPISNEDITNPVLRIDSVKPYASNVSFSAELNNSHVKDAKTDNSEDESDTYLGAGDKLSITVTMNEALNLTLENKTAEGYPILDWQYGVATTNIKAPADYTGDKDSNGYVTLKTRWFTPSEPNKYTRRQTQFLLETLTVTEGMTTEKTTDNPNGGVIITKLDLSGYKKTIADMCGNEIADKSNVKIETGANSSPYFLDTEPPEVKKQSIYTPLDDGFRYGISIDKGSGTEVAGSYGTFVLSHSGDKRAYRYEWAFSMESDVNRIMGDEWRIGVTGVEQKFYQHQQGYFYIRTIAGEEYQMLDKCVLTVKARDYAGNIGTFTTASSDEEAYDIKWYVDNAAPSIQPGTTNRTLTGDVGKIEAEVKLSDSHGISAWQYAWTDSDTDEPSAWTAGAVSGDDTDVTVKAEATVSSGNAFSKYLWVKAADNSNNENSAVSCLGQYTYDLTAAEYTLKYTAAVTEKADIRVTSLKSGDALVFAVKLDDGTSWVRAVKSSEYSADKNVFDLADWNRGTLTETSDGVYEFQNVTQTADSISPKGNVEVTILAGKEDALTLSASGAFQKAGNASQRYSDERVRLRASGSNPWVNYSILQSEDDIDPNDYIWLTPNGGYDAVYGRNTAQIWENGVLKTLAGEKFDIAVKQDRYNWECADIDTSKSKLVFTERSTKARAESAIGSFRKNADGEYVQTVTVTGDFATGVYDAALELVSVTGVSCKIPLGFIADDGKKYEYTSGIVVDAAEANDSLTIDSIIYGPNSFTKPNMYGIGDVYYERDCVTDKAIEIPVAGGEFAEYGTAPGDIYKVTFKSDKPEGEDEREELKDGSTLISYTGQYYIEAWTDSQTGKRVKFYAADEKQKEFASGGTQQLDGKTVLGRGFTADETLKEDENYVYLTPDTENTVYFRKVYANGSYSSVQSAKIKPVTQQLTGEISIDKTTGQLIFTRTSAIETAKGAEVYAVAYQNGPDYLDGKGEVISMGSTASGDWRCSLVSNGAIYRVFTVNSAGSLWADGDEYLAQRAPWFKNVSYTGNEGSYELSFDVYDDCNTILEDGLQLNIGFNEAYSRDGFSIKMSKELFENDSYTWQTEGGSSSGIYELSAIKYSMSDSDLLSVTVKGAVKKQNADTQTKQQMNISISAADAYGNTAQAETGEKTVKYVQPKPLSNELAEHGLKITFNQPVLPAESWAWRDSDPYDDYGNKLGYGKEWEGGFPIISNGTHEIEFRDVFGNACTAEVTTTAFTKDGYDWSTELEFSEERLTKEAVYLTARLSGENKKPQTGVIIWNDDKSEIIIPEGNYDGFYYQANRYNDFDPDKPWTSWAKNATSTPRTVKLENNMRLEVKAVNNTWVNENWSGLVYSQRVYVDNIAKEAPEATIHYYFPELGQEFLQKDLEEYIEKNGGEVEIYGTAKVWYTTSRHVTPIENTGSEYYFDKNNQSTSYTFKYKDEMENTGETTVSLPDGITLKELPVPYVDVTPPTVSVEIAGEYYDRYVSLDSFLAGSTGATADEIKQKLAEIGTVQSLCLTVNASDVSGFDISLSDGKGGAAPEGITLAGNLVIIEKAADFTVTVTDKSEYRNKTELEITAEMLAYLDSTPPTAEITEKPKGMYAKTITAKLSDTDNNGSSTTKGEGGAELDNITLISPEGAVKVGTNTYTYEVTDNGNVEFVFYDSVGNRSKSEDSTASVTGIDNSAPKLEVTWSPPLTYYDDVQEQYVTDRGMPTNEAVNTNVTAFIDSDKVMSKLTVNILGVDIKLLENGAPTENNPYPITGSDGKPYAEIKAAPERIIVTYYSSQDSLDLNFTAEAPNGRSSTECVYSYNFEIDKTAPTAKVKCDYKLKTTDCTVPYMAVVTIEPNEWVYSPNYGEVKTDTDPDTKKEYEYYMGEDYPLVLEFRKNGVYNVQLADKAGNVTVIPVEITGLDRTAPEITLGEVTESGQSASVPVTVNEACTVSVGSRKYTFTADETQNIEFTDNGTYIITATDAAGNEASRAVAIGNIDKIMPSISFDTNTIYVLKGSSAAELLAALNSGYTVWDDITAAAELAVKIDSSEVQLNEAGIYSVGYSVTDKAENKAEAVRFVQVIGEETVCVRINGTLILPGSTALVKLGSENSMTLENCTEPFTVKARKGILALGQLKPIAENTLSFDENNSFTVNSAGYYTLLVTTQSRQTIRVLVYAN